MNDISKINATLKQISEGHLGDMAQRCEQDHEVQMARADLYKLAKYAIKLHEMLKNVSEERGLEGWQQAKITKAADYISSVYHNLDYEMSGMDVGGEVDTVEINPEFEDVGVAEAKSKPDYLDLDKDGDTKEPMKKAAQDAKKKTNESKFSDWGKK